MLWELHNTQEMTLGFGRGLQTVAAPLGLLSCSVTEDRPTPFPEPREPKLCPTPVSLPGEHPSLVQLQRPSESLRRQTAATS